MKHSGYFLTVFFLGWLIISCGTDSKPTYTLTTTAIPAEAGSVTPASGEFTEGESVQITASPNEHWVFNRWEGDLSGTQNPASVTINSDKDIAAVFVVRDYPLTITIEGDGSVEEQVIQPKTTDHPYGTQVQLTAIPGEDWQFSGWSGALSSNENPQVLLIDQAKQVTALFTEIPDPPDIPLALTDFFPVMMDLSYMNSLHIPDDEEEQENYTNFKNARKWMNVAYIEHFLDSGSGDFFWIFDFADIRTPQYDGESWIWDAVLPDTLMAFKIAASIPDDYEVKFIIKATPEGEGFDWLFTLHGSVGEEVFIHTDVLSGYRAENKLNGVWYSHEFDDDYGTPKNTPENKMEIYRWSMVSDSEYEYSHVYEYEEKQTERVYWYPGGISVERMMEQYLVIIHPEKIHPDQPELDLHITIFWDEDTRSGWYEDSTGERFCFENLINTPCM